MSKTARAGATALIVGPLLALITNLVLPTLSEEPTARVSALTTHRGAMVGGMTLEVISIVLMTAGVVWLATALLPAARRLAVAGGVLGVAGALVVLFEDGIASSAPSIVRALDAAQADRVLTQIHSSAAAALEPASLLLDVGLVCLAAAAVKAGVPRWLGVAVAVSAIAQGIGLASASRPLAVVAFAALAACLAALVRALVGGSTWRPAQAAAAAA